MIKVKAGSDQFDGFLQELIQVEGTADVAGDLCRSLELEGGLLAFIQKRTLWIAPET